MQKHRQVFVKVVLHFAGRQPLKHSRQVVALTELYHELLEGAGYFLALRHRTLEKMLVKLTHQPEAGPFVQKVKFRFG